MGSKEKKTPFRRSFPVLHPSSFLFLFILLPLVAAPAQTGTAQPNPASRSIPAAPAEFPEGRPAFRIFTDKNGLPHNSPMAMTVDNRGYVWIGTQYGAAYFNGRRWTTLNMPDRAASNFIFAMCSTSDGSVWFGTLGAGLVRLKDGRWTTFNDKNGALPGNRVRSLLETASPAGTSVLWVGTETGLARYENENWTVFTSGNSKFPGGSVRGLAETALSDGRRALWIGIDGGGLVRFDPARDDWTRWTAADSGLADNRVWCLRASRTTDGRTALWIGTEGGLAFAVEKAAEPSGRVGLDWTFFTSESSGLAHNSVNCLLETTAPDGRRTLWIGTYGGGLARLQGVETLGTAHPGGLRWAAWNSKNSGLADIVVSLLETKSDGTRATIWAGTNAGGLICFEDGQWLTVDMKNSALPDNIVRGILESVSTDGRKTLWVSTWGGLARFEDGVWTVHTTKNSALPSDRAERMVETKSADGRRTIWVATVGGGLVRLDETGPLGARPAQYRWTVYTAANSGLPNDRINGLTASRTDDGRLVLLVGTFGGFARFEPDDNRWTLFSTKNSALPHDRVESFYETTAPHGRRALWVGTYGGGLTRIEGDAWTIFNSGNSGLPNNTVQVIQETTVPDGRRLILAGTQGGLVWFDPQSPTKPWAIISETTQPALPNNVVSQVHQTSNGMLYVFTFKGITRLTPRTPTPDDPSPFMAYTYTTEDGLPGNGINPLAGIVDRAGRIWAGTLYGLAVFDPARAVEDRTEKRLILERVSVNGKTLSAFLAPNAKLAEFIGPGEPLPTGEVSLAYDENRVEFEFALLNWFRDGDTRYACQLVGLEREPSEWRPDARKEYAALPAGRYVFRVSGRDYAGNVSGPVEFAFTVRPAPWRTWWAYLFYAACVGGLGYGAYLRRIRLLKRRENERIAHLQELQEQKLEHLRQMQQQRLALVHQLHEEQMAGLRRLLESIRVINSQLDVTTVLQNIAEEGARLVDGEPGGIGLVEGDQLVFKRLWMNGRWEDGPLSFPLGDGVAGRVAATGEAVIVNDIHAVPGLKYRELIEKYDVWGMMEIPVVSRTGTVVGVLDIRRPRDREPFTDEDRELVESLGHQAAVAIEKAALYDELEKLYRHEREVTHVLQELNQMKTNFLIVTSHEMRTPLTVLKGYNEALLEEYLGPLTETQKRSLETCRRMVERMVLSFNEILEMLKINEGRAGLKPTAFDLCAEIRKEVDELQPFLDQRSLRVSLDMPERVTVEADLEKIGLVLINLIQNAVKFTPNGGHIVLRVAPESEEVRIMVEDSGIGIERSELSRIFETFYTSRDPSTHSSGRFEFSARGSGLGLAIAKSYTEAHGGRIWAESDGPGRGSRFIIVLPYVFAPRRESREFGKVTVGKEG